MHILILPSWYVNTANSLSGIFFKEQAEALAESGHTVGVINVSSISVSEVAKQKKLFFHSVDFIENNVQTLQVEYPSIPKARQLNRLIQFTIGKVLVKKYIKTYGYPDIIHLHSFLVGDLALWMKKKYKIPYVITEHSTGFAKNYFTNNELNLAKLVYKNADYKIAVSNQFALLLKEKTGYLFNYLPNIVNTDFFIPAKEPNSQGFTFLNVALLQKKKNQLMLIKAFTKSFKSSSNTFLIIAGGGSEFHILEKEINNLGMQKQIRLFGKASRLEVRQLMQESNCFILPSIYETFGVVLIEAMSTGIPVISTRSGGPDSIITNSSLGRLCNTNIKSLSSSMESVRNKHHDSSLIREYALEHFSQKSIAKKLLKIYSDILQIEEIS